MRLIVISGGFSECLQKFKGSPLADGTIVIDPLRSVADQIREAADKDGPYADGDTIWLSLTLRGQSFGAFAEVCGLYRSDSSSIVGCLLGLLSISDLVTTAYYRSVIEANVRQ